MKKTYVDQGRSVCGFCHAGFSDANPPHEVIRRVDEPPGFFAYREPEPWHVDCIRQANEDERAVKP